MYQLKIHLAFLLTDIPYGIVLVWCIAGVLVIILVIVAVYYSYVICCQKKRGNQRYLFLKNHKQCAKILVFELRDASKWKALYTTWTIDGHLIKVPIQQYTGKIFYRQLRSRGLYYTSLKQRVWGGRRGFVLSFCCLYHLKCGQKAATLSFTNNVFPKVKSYSE